jgi:hypothetical protein
MKRKSKDERYLAVAKSCLKVLTSQSILEADKQKNIDALYSSIEKALGEEFHCLLDEYNKLEVALRKISDIKTTADDANSEDSAIQIARKALGQDPAIH